MLAKVAFDIIFNPKTWSKDEAVGREAADLLTG
jgi:hypothetical protein